MKRYLKIGVAADDYTGASDAASFLQKAGVSVSLYNSIPAELNSACDAVVIALKSRTDETCRAVEATLSALEKLREGGARMLYLKYCSTFDSTPKGNIGPVLDALLERYNQPYTLICPALPENGRTVRDGVLYVYGVPLSESHMKDHPLTPMWDSRIAVLMQAQSRYPCFILPLSDLRQGREHVESVVSDLMRQHEHFYLIPDYYEDSHADLIASVFPELMLLSGGSALLEAYAGRLPDRAENMKRTGTERVYGKSLLLSGSCSAMTQKQVAAYRQTGNRCIRITPDELIDGTTTPESLWHAIGGEDGVLVYSTADPTDVRKNQAKHLSAERVSAVLEETMGHLAQKAVDSGYTRIIVAGGETSGAVVRDLGYDSFLVGRSVAPGVPILTPTENESVRLVLKSGNFGDESFFQKAREMSEHDEDL